MAEFIVLGKDEADTPSLALASAFVKDNRDKKCTNVEATCRTSVSQLLSKETRTAYSEHHTFVVVTIQPCY